MKKPSVSQLLDLLAKPALIKWANKQGLKGIEVSAYRKKKLEDGTSMHSQIESGCFELKEDAESFSRFSAAHEILDSEQSIETDWFVGRYDVRFKTESGVFIGDYKTKFRGKLYLEHKLQLIAYTMAVPAKMAIISAPSFSVFEFLPDQRKPYEEILKTLSYLWILTKEIEE